MQYRKRDFGGKRTCCKPCQSGAQAKSRAAIATKGLTKPRSTKTQSSLAIEAPTKSASTKTQSSPG